MSIGDRFDTDREETLTPVDRRADRRRAESQHRRLRDTNDSGGDKRPKMRHQRTGGRIRYWDDEEDDE